MNKVIIVLFVWMILAISACAAPTPIIIVVTATPAPPQSNPTALPPTSAPLPSNTPLPTVLTIPPTPVTGLALPSLKISAIDGQGFTMNDPVMSGEAVAKDYLVFRIRICYPDCKNNRADGKDVKDVSFYFCKANVNDCRASTAFYSHTENNPAYCSFGGGEPNCDVLYFNQTDKWPNGVKIENGDYKLSIEAHSNVQNAFWKGTVSFQIRR